MQSKKTMSMSVHLTLRDSLQDGVHGSYNSSNIHLDNVNVENSGHHGVSVSGSKRNTMKNCNVSYSKQSGLCVSGGLMTIDGNGTTIHHNCIYVRSWYYGLDANDYFSSIHLASPLTIETISKNNGGGGNHGGSGKIKTVDKDGKVLEVVFDGRPDEEDV